MDFRRRNYTAGLHGLQLSGVVTLKSDDESLRQHLVEHIRDVDRGRKIAFDQIRKKARERNWQVETEGVELKVLCPSYEDNELKEIALHCGLKAEKNDEGN